MRPQGSAVQAPRRSRTHPATLAMVTNAPTLTVVRAVPDPVYQIEQGILRDAQIILRRLTRRLDAEVARLVAARLTPLDAAEARRFLRDFRSGELV